MKRVLFVDDEPHVLDALRRMLRHMRDEWDAEFVLNAAAALERIADHPFDVVVSDIRMPGMDGAQLLEQVRRRSPAAARIVLSGHCDRDAVMRTVKVAHQFLTKPCDSEDIKATVLRACRRADRLSDPWHRELVSRVASVPSPLSAHAALGAELEAAEPSPDRVGEIVARDVGAAAKLLQLVSSSFFGSSRSVSHPTRWPGWLGIDTVKLLVQREKVVRALHAGAAANASLETLNAHSVAVARSARLLAEAEGLSTAQIDQAYLAGLLHEVGLFILAESTEQGARSREHAAGSMEQPIACVNSRLPAPSSQLPDPAPGKTLNYSGCRVPAAADLPVTHADLGGCLLALWGAPETIVDAVALHHAPARSAQTAFGVLTAVHVANAVAEAAQRDLATATPLVDVEYLDKLGGADRLPQWCTICESAKAEAVPA